MFLNPQSGRFILRTTGSREIALVGVLTLPAGATIVEGACYLLELDRGRIRLSDAPVLGRSERCIESSGIINLTQPHWPSLQCDGVLPVRSFAAFPETNTWVVYGASNRPVASDLVRDPSGHACIDIQSGAYRGMPMPIAAAGESMQGLLSTHAIWPDAHGTLYALPTHHSEWRHHYRRMAEILARYGRSEITLDAVKAALRADAALDVIRPHLIDPDYARYLALLQDLGGLDLQCPRDAAALAADELRADRCIRQLLLAA